MYNRKRRATGGNSVVVPQTLGSFSKVVSAVGIHYGQLRGGIGRRTPAKES